MHFANQGNEYYSGKLEILNNDGFDIAGLEAELANQQKIYGERTRSLDKWDYVLYGVVPGVLSLFVDGRKVMTRAAGGAVSSAADKATQAAFDRFRSK